MNSNNNQQFIFFLGGHDAEMNTIQGILDMKKIPYFDNKLSWGAKLSEYHDKIKNLKPYQVPVFVELNIDIDKPQNAIEIDHHGHRAGKDKETSIEQVAGLLKIELDRWQKLISANDRGYIPAMKRMGATNDEIKEIRDYDKECQGVTPEDERLAEKSIRENTKILGEGKNALLINSLLEKSACIADRIWYEWQEKYSEIFIITPKRELNFYGSGRMVYRLKALYEHLKRSDNTIEFWFGGELPISGYFGSNQALPQDTIKSMVEHPIISQHIFMFPFKIEDQGNNTDIDNQQELKRNKNKKSNEIEREKSCSTLREKYTELLESDGWQEKTFMITDSVLNYNEFVYFHDFVRDVMFPDNYSDSTSSTSIYYEKTANNRSEMVIHIKTDNEPIKYYLEINHVALRLFDTEVGILTIELLNYCYQGLNDILLINDFGRRIYPQYLGEHNGIDAPKSSFFADRIEFILNNDTTDQTFKIEDFFNPGLGYPKHRDLKIAQYIINTLGKRFYDKYLLSPVIDDRMFVVCWYGNDKLISYLLEWDSRQNCFNYENSEKWYKYIFIDGKDIGIANQVMMRELINNTTYPRWIEWGTLFGISRYSLVCMTDRNSFAYNLIRVHMERIYYQIAVLLLIERASIIKFSDKVAEISKKLNPVTKNTKELDELVKIVSRLDKEIIRFNNTICQQEVTPQEQGIEMFKMGLKNMEIELHLRNLKEKVQDLFNCVDLASERETSKGIGIFTVINAVFLPLALLASIWGMNLYFMNNFYNNSDTGFNVLEMNLISLIVFGLSLIFIIGYTSSLLGVIKEKSDLQVTNKKFLVKTVLEPLLKPFPLIFGIIIIGIIVITIFFPEFIITIVKWSKSWLN